MSSSTGTVIFEDATLQAVEIVADTMTLNNFSVSSTTSLQQATNTGNVTTNTVRFTNPTTAFVTTANVEVGTANLFVDTTTGRVGVGTGSPAYPLDVSFSGDSGIALRSTSSHTSINMYPNSGYSYLRFHEANGSASVWLQALAGGHLAIRPQGGSETVRFDANGYVLNNNPAFWAYDSGTTTATATGAWTYFGDTTLNIGSHYDTTNKRFYAPITGTYSFQGSALYRYRSALGRCELTFYKNGTNVNTRGLSYSLLNLSSGHAQATISYIINLNAGDYMQIGAYAIDSGVDFYVGQGLGYFSGYLIG